MGAHKRISVSVSFSLFGACMQRAQVYRGRCHRGTAARRTVRWPCLACLCAPSRVCREKRWPRCETSGTVARVKIVWRIRLVPVVLSGKKYRMYVEGSTGARGRSFVCAHRSGGGPAQETPQTIRVASI